jgi:protein CsiD
MQSIQTQRVIPFKTRKISQRVYSIDFESEFIKKYLTKINQTSVRDLEYIPYARFLIAREFENIFSIKDYLSEMLRDYETGAFRLNFNCSESHETDFIKLSTAISYLLGVPGRDPLTGIYYAIFTVRHDDSNLPSLLRPYEVFKMHTDGAYMKKIPDWIFFMKTSETAAWGGESRLLHIEDWEDFDYFHSHPMQKQRIKFFATPHSSASDHRYVNPDNNIVYSSVLNVKNNFKSIRFVDRFMHPENLDETDYIFEIQNSLENSQSIVEIDIPTGSMLVINNHHWLHGRNSFQQNPMLNRRLMRQRGVFSMNR